MIADIHAHLDMFSEKEVEKIIKNAEKRGVKVIVTNSVNLDSCNKNLLYSKKNEEIVKLAVGFYPQDALSREEKKEKKKETFEELEQFVADNKKYIFAVGEIGMDFFHGKDRKSQEDLLRKELKLAEKLKVPAIIHSRKAEKEVIELIKDFSCVKILHCFNGNFSLIQKALDYGCYFSIPTNIVRLEHFKKMVREIPKNKILTETDSPFLSPHPGKKNEPAFINETIKLISSIWGINENETEKILWNNFSQAFNYKID